MVSGDAKTVPIFQQCPPSARVEQIELIDFRECFWLIVAPGGTMMRQERQTQFHSAEKTVRDIHRATHRRFSVKISVV